MRKASKIGSNRNVQYQQHKKGKFLSSQSPKQWFQRVVENFCKSGFYIRTISCAVVVKNSVYFLCIILRVGNFRHAGQMRPELSFQVACIRKCIT